MDTIFHRPYYSRHIISGPIIESFNEDYIHLKTNYVVFRSRPTGDSEIFNVGYYKDIWQILPEGLKIKERICVYDTEMIPNALIYPI